MSADIPFGDDRPLPPPLTADELALARQARAHLNGHNEPADPQPNSWQPANLIQLAANPPAPPTIGGLLYPAKRTVLSGETESMKTWLALILCKAELDIGIPVGWVDLDAMGPGAMLERLHLLGVEDDQIEANFLYYEPSQMLDKPMLDEVTTTIQERGIRLFVIDAFNPILGLLGFDYEKTRDVEKFWTSVADPICAAGAAPVMLDHVVKNADNRGKYSIGSERKATGSIIHIGFKLLETLERGGRGRSLLTVHKDRPGYLQRPSIGRLVLTSTDDGIAYQLEADKSHDTDKFRPTVLMQRISEHLEKQTAPLSQTTIVTDVPGKAEALRTALQTLVDDAYVKADPAPKKGHFYTTIRPYREASDTPNTTPSQPRPHSVPTLRSTPTLHPVPSPPLWGTGTGSDGGPEPKTVPTPSQPIGDTIPEYDFPPIDEGQADDLDDTPDRWFDR